VFSQGSKEIYSGSQQSSIRTKGKVKPPGNQAE
jgi:hypothetical protein